MAGEAPIAFDDLRAGVAAGLLTEAQAADLTALSRARAAGADADDERFELFRGFNEVFITVGIVLLLWGMDLFIARDSVVSMLGASGMVWLLAEYFTRRRRMILPSIVLCLIFTATIVAAVWTVMQGEGSSFDHFAIVFGAGAGAAFAFFARFRLPFALSPAGLLALAATLFFVGGADAESLMASVQASGATALLDLNAGGPFAFVTLIFGLAAFALAMSFDLRDPHRVTSRAACGFWLHVLAGPAIVNTAAFTFKGMDSAIGGPMLTAFMLFMALVAVVIDRRSFLIAASGYLAAIITGAIAQIGVFSTAGTLILLGVGILILGAGWTGIRGRVMRALPGFPGKGRLPPYRKAAP